MDCIDKGLRGSVGLVIVEVETSVATIYWPGGRDAPHLGRSTSSRSTIRPPTHTATMRGALCTRSRQSQVVSAVDQLPGSGIPHPLVPDGP